jgi:hypothetical protein
MHGDEGVTHELRSRCVGDEWRGVEWKGSGGR